MYAATPGSNQCIRDCTDHPAVSARSAAQKPDGEERVIRAPDFKIDKTCSSSLDATPKPLLPPFNSVADNVGSPLLHSTDVYVHTDPPLGHRRTKSFTQERGERGRKPKSPFLWRTSAGHPFYKGFAIFITSSSGIPGLQNSSNFITNAAYVCAWSYHVFKRKAKFSFARREHDREL